MNSKEDRQSYAKKTIRGKGKDVAEQRADRRQRLVQNFKSLRIQAIDRFRNLKDDDLTYEVLCQFRKEILSTLDSGSVIDEDDVDGVLEDLEEELKILQNEQYERTCAEEIDAITSNLMNQCDICDNLIVDSGICDPCIESHFKSQF